MTITRRTVLASTALAAAPIAGPALAQTASPPAPAQGAASRQAPGFYRYKVGDIEVTAINDGFAHRPLEGFVRNADLSAGAAGHAGGLPAAERAARSPSTRSC